MQIYASEELNQHSGPLVFLFGQLLSSIPFLFLISISSSLVFYFLVGLRDEFGLLMYFVLNFFLCLLVNEGLMLVVVSLWQNVFWSILTLVSIHVSSPFKFQKNVSFNLWEITIRECLVYGKKSTAILVLFMLFTHCKLFLMLHHLVI